MSTARPVEMMVEQQARRWQLRRADEEQQQRRRGGVIAVSRLEGAGGDEVAGVLARRLGYDLFDREIIHQIAQNVHLSDRVVMALDDRDRGLLAEWLVGFAVDAPLTRYEYLHELRKVVGTIARHGSAVIVGRGAHLILGPQEALRVLVVAPLDVRAAQVGLTAGLSQRAARQRILAAEAERRAFLAKHFQAPLGDPEWFDLVVNTHVLGIEGAADVIQAALPRSASRAVA